MPPLTHTWRHVSLEYVWAFCNGYKTCIPSITAALSTRSTWWWWWWWWQKSLVCPSVCFSVTVFSLYALIAALRLTHSVGYRFRMEFDVRHVRYRYTKTSAIRFRCLTHRSFDSRSTLKNTGVPGDGRHRMPGDGRHRMPWDERHRMPGDEGRNTFDTIFRKFRDDIQHYFRLKRLLPSLIHCYCRHCSTVNPSYFRILVF